MVVPVRGQQEDGASSLSEEAAVASELDGFGSSTATEDLPDVRASPNDGAEEEDNEEEDTDEDGFEEEDGEAVEEGEEEEDGDEDDDADGEQESSGDADLGGSEEDDPEPRDGESPPVVQDCNCEVDVRNAVVPLEQAVEQTRHERDELQGELSALRMVYDRLVESHTALTQVKDANHQELGQLRDSLRRAEDHIRELHLAAAAHAAALGGEDLGHPGISLVRQIGKVVKKAIADVQAFVDAKMKQLTKQE